tara:strand:- start:6221 stop:7348 length:1128 start_codon:yes stop_codon:yes gene_type:complete
LKNLNSKINSILSTGIKNVHNVGRCLFGNGSILEINEIINSRKKKLPGRVIFFIDIFFKDKTKLIQSLNIENNDKTIFVDTIKEPTTLLINQIRDIILNESTKKPSAIVAIGGGSTMDVAKAVANLLTNPGNAEDYQGWDLLKNPTVYKIAIPTISGTGSESTRTCVMINPSNGLKLGMNSDFTVNNQIILDPELTSTVPKDQYFWTGMDAYIHSFESLEGAYRNPIGDAYSNQAIQICRNVFLSKDMKTEENRSNLMVASYLGGCAIATSYVGIVHPLSAALSVVLGTHHCLANCIVMRAMEEFYKKTYKEFWNMVEKQNVYIPTGICQNLNEEVLDKLYESTIIHEKPLTNALGEDYKNIFTKKKIIQIFSKM